MKHDVYTSMKPQFIDILAVDIVVNEKRFLKLTAPERRHAAHRLIAAGVPAMDVMYILHISHTTFQRIMASPPPPILDINERGDIIVC